MRVMTYSLKFRQRVMQIKKEENLTYEATSQRFKVGIRSLFRWEKKLEPQKTRQKPATKIDMKALKKDVEANPDKYLYERAKDQNVSVSGIFFALKRLGLSRKKNAVSPKSRRSKKN